MATSRGRQNLDHTNPFFDELKAAYGDQIEQQAQQTNLDSIKRPLASTEDSHEVVCKTAEELEYQGEQLSRIERNLHFIEDNIIMVGNRYVTSLKSISRTVVNYFKRAPKQTSSQHPAENPPKEGLNNMTTSYAFEPSSSNTQQYGTSTCSSYSANQVKQTQSLASNDLYEQQLLQNDRLDLMTKNLRRLREDDLKISNQIDRVKRQKMRKSQQRTLDSTKRSLALIENSHNAACRTAEDLEYLGEKYNLNERNLDIIHDDTRVANRHITSMKSIFGTVGNYFKRAPKQTASSHPAENPKEGLNSVTTSNAFEPSSSNTQQCGTSTGSSCSAYHVTQTQSFVPNDPYERQINENLDLMTKGLGRLKEDTLFLVNEVDRQNAELSLMTKAERES